MRDKSTWTRRETLRNCVIVGGGLTIGTLATGTAAAAQTGGKAIGGVVYTDIFGEITRVSFSAHGTDHPQGPRGKVSVRGHFGVDFKGDVDCYSQSGNRAWFSGPITKATGTPIIDGTDFFVIGVEDNGQPNDNSPVDEIAVRRESGPLYCTSPGKHQFRLVEKGDLTVYQ